MWSSPLMPPGQLAPWLALGPATLFLASGPVHTLFPLPRSGFLHPANTCFSSRFQLGVTFSRVTRPTSLHKAIHDSLCALNCVLCTSMTLPCPQLQPLSSLMLPHGLASLYDSPVPVVPWAPVPSAPHQGLTLCFSTSHHCGRPDRFHSDQDGPCGPHVPQHRVTSPNCVLEQSRRPAGGKGQWLSGPALW